MADNTLLQTLLEKLSATKDPTENAAIIADLTFAQQPAPIAEIARHCIILRWFDATIVTAFLPKQTETAVILTADEVTNQLARLPFVEHLPWGLTYHEQTRAGLLERYAEEQPDLLRHAALLATPAYQQHSNAAFAGQEALFCSIVAGETETAQARLDDLIKDVGREEDWDGLNALFTTCEQAALLPFVQPLQYTAFHCYAKGIALDELGKKDEAIAAYQQAIALDNKYAYPWNGLGNAYRDLKRYDEAIAAYQQAIALDDKFAYPWNGLGNAYRDLKRYEEAIAAFQQAIALDDKFASPWIMLIALYRKLERWQEAENSVRHAITLIPTDWVQWAGLADILRRKGDQVGWQEAVEQARTLIDYSDLYNAACFESVAGNVEKALDLLAQAAAQGGSILHGQRKIPI